MGLRPDCLIATDSVVGDHFFLEAKRINKRLDEKLQVSVGHAKRVWITRQVYC